MSRFSKAVPSIVSKTDSLSHGNMRFSGVPTETRLVDIEERSCTIDCVSAQPKLISIR
jgi:hypothetical protein